MKPPRASLDLSKSCRTSPPPLLAAPHLGLSLSAATPTEARASRPPSLCLPMNLITAQLHHHLRPQARAFQLPTQALLRALAESPTVGTSPRPPETRVSDVQPPPAA
ncbi:hypothetical protein M0R45_006268 [Rubus argutus]|uniref:Uncharacterized protein n=1 Tax=Rubus argutus TaxID=59490 RepID=A0AAW1YQR1_RUBAR